MGPPTLTLVEHFAGPEAVARHTASDYFQRFRTAQEPLLAQPAEMRIYERVVE